MKRADSDEAYVLDLCDQALGQTGARQATFDFLRGDSRIEGKNGRRLQVDIYFASLDLVVEYHERQHSEPVPHFDKPDQITVSGVDRGEQRKIYDSRRAGLLPRHGIDLAIIRHSDFANSKGKIQRQSSDIDVVRSILQNWMPSS